MIQLSRLNHAPLILNSDLIQHIEITPDTVIVLMNGQKIVVTESADEIVSKIIEFRRSLFDAVGCPRLSSGALPVHVAYRHGD